MNFNKKSLFTFNNFFYYIELIEYISTTKLYSINVTKIEIREIFELLDLDLEDKFFNYLKKIYSISDESAFSFFIARKINAFYI